MKTAHATRGAALPETALVLTATLAMIFGIIQVGIIGFLQIMVDGAAFIAAHEYAIGNTSPAGSTSYQTYAQQVFPLATSPPGIQTNLPNPTTVAVNYNSVNNTTQRHGGVSLVLSNHIQAKVTSNAPGGLLGVGVAALSGLSVQGAAIEPEDWVSNDAYDVDGNGYGSASQLSAYSSNVQNAPANYISAHYMARCTLTGIGSFAAQCPTANTVVLALGTAEFLDHDNWNRTNLGVGPYSSSYTFGEMLCHQQVFARIAAQVFAPRASWPLPSMSPAPALITQVNGWDVVASSGGYSYTENKLGAYPLHPVGNPPSASC